MHIEKAKLPKGMCYPLKSTMLANALAAAGITIDTQLIIAPSKIFFDAHFWPPNQNVDYERLYIRAGAVPAAEGYTARCYMENVVIPELIVWLKSILDQPADSVRRQQKQLFWKDMPHVE